VEIQEQEKDPEKDKIGEVRHLNPFFLNLLLIPAYTKFQPSLML